MAKNSTAISHRYTAGITVRIQHSSSTSGRKTRQSKFGRDPRTIARAHSVDILPFNTLDRFGVIFGSFGNIVELPSCSKNDLSALDTRHNYV